MSKYDPMTCRACGREIKGRWQARQGEWYHPSHVPSYRDIQRGNLSARVKR